MINLHRETMFAESIRTMLNSLKLYADTHRAAYDSPIGEDYVVGEHWKQIASGLIGLLNGETGTVDCGFMDRDIRELARKNGFSEQEIDQL